MARHMYKETSMNADQTGKFLATQKTEMTQFLTDIGLTTKK